MKMRIAAPCTESWAEMRGDTRMRHCERCRLNVYNLSAMTRPEAEELIRRTEGRLCVRFYQRKDGTVLTRDCPVGLEARHLRRFVAVAATLVLALLACIVAGSSPLKYGKHRWVVAIEEFFNPRPAVVVGSPPMPPPRRP